MSRDTSQADLVAIIRDLRTRVTNLERRRLDTPPKVTLADVVAANEWRRARFPVTDGLTADGWAPMRSGVSASAFYLDNWNGAYQIVVSDLLIFLTIWGQFTSSPTDYAGTNNYWLGALWADGTVVGPDYTATFGVADFGALFTPDGNTGGLSTIADAPMPCGSWWDDTVDRTYTLGLLWQAEDTNAPDIYWHDTDSASSDYSVMGEVAKPFESGDWFDLSFFVMRGIP